MAATFVRNIEPFAASTGEGFLRVIRLGEIIETSDPVYKGRAHLFEPVEDHAAREVDRRKGVGALPVERVTAAPGERRDVHIPSPSEADAKPDATTTVAKDDEDRPKAIPGYVCDHDGCDFNSVSERGLKIHKRTHED